MAAFDALKFVIFDADDTLVDYPADAARSFHAALGAVGCDTPACFEEAVRFDFGNWDKAGLSNVHLKHIQKSYHELYRRHVAAIFDHLEQTVGLGGRVREAEEAFYAAFSEPGTPTPGAIGTVAALKKKYKVYAATNGLSLQHARLREFGLDGVFVSEEAGAIKPHAAFFRNILKTLGAEPWECLMVGDSLASDIRGAVAVGMPAILYDPRGKGAEGFSIRALPELLDIL